MNTNGRIATISYGRGLGRGLAPYRRLAVSIAPAIIVGFFAIGTLQAASYSTASITIRGKEQALFVYEPAAGVQKRPLIEYARKMFSLHHGPKRFISVNAVNHRFSDKVAEVLSHLEQSLQWLQDHAPG